VRYVDSSMLTLLPKAIHLPSCNIIKHCVKQIITAISLKMSYYTVTTLKIKSQTTVSNLISV